MSTAQPLLRNPTPVSIGFYARAGKRLADTVFAITCLVLLLPLMIFIAIGIKLFDPGSIFFRQERVGRHGRLFKFYKFRSMPVGTKNLPSDQVGSLRLTWIGKLLRRTNLDELPQLYNILLGDMSLVGPRPPIPNQFELLELRRANGSIACRPGLTGLAQIRAYDHMPVSEKADLDSQYAARITLGGDLRIILSTFIYLLRPPPLY